MKEEASVKPEMELKAEVASLEAMASEQSMPELVKASLHHLKMHLELQKALREKNALEQDQVSVVLYNYIPMFRVEGLDQ